MQKLATALLLLIVFVHCSPGFRTRENVWSIHGPRLCGDDKNSWSCDLGRGGNLLPLGIGNIWSLLHLEGNPAQTRIIQLVHNLEEPVNSDSHVQTVRELQEKLDDAVEKETDPAILGYSPHAQHFNYMPSRNLDIRKRLDDPETPDTEDKIGHYLIQPFNAYHEGIRNVEALDSSVRITRFSKDESKQNRDLSMFTLNKRQLPMLTLGKRQMLTLGKRHLPMLRLGKRQLPMFRLGKRQLPMLKLGKRQLPMLRLGKRQLPMLRLGKRQLPMLRLGKRQLPMLRLGKRQLPMLRLDKRQLPMLRLGKRQTLEMASFFPPQLELIR